MATLAESLISSSSRPLRLRMRPDLQAKRQTYQGRTYWVVKEPVGLNYFRFHEEEYAILCMLDGQSSLQDIKDKFEREFMPQKITFTDLQQFVGMLHRSGLVLSDAPGQGKQLKKRRDDKKWKELLGKFANVFALRFRGIDPERLLNWLMPYTRWFFGPLGRLMVFTLGLAALSLVAVQFHVFQSRLPAFHEFFGPKNWLWMAVVMAVVKVLHEFGHGLSCKYYGGECHEMGFMMLVFTPALYCNVSDSWMLPNKWHRVFIGFAGMYVEIFLASIATFLWWFSEPGMLNYICLSVMFICSVSTVVFNGNPLLRFDGYYMLMDALEIPNLRQKSTEVLKRYLVELCLGIEQPENPFLPQEKQFLFGLYTLAAVVYRWIVVFSIIWFLNEVFEPYGLKIIGRLIALSGFVGLVVQPLWALWKFFYTPGRMTKVKSNRVAATVGVVVAAIAIVIWLPLPFHVACSVQVKPRDAETIYASTPGYLDDLKVKPGQTVKEGDTLARLSNINLTLAVLQLEGERDQRNAELRGLLFERYKDEKAQSRIPSVTAQLKSAEEQLEEKRSELARLEITAPLAGTVLPAEPKSSKQEQMEGTLPKWSGSVFEAKNDGAYLERTDALCVIGDPTKMKAMLVIDQADVDLVREHHEVEIMLDAFPGEVLKSKVEVIAAQNLKESPMSLASSTGGELDTKTDKTGRARPLHTSYPAQANLDNSDARLRIGMRGKAKVYTGWQPLGKRIYRYVARTFHFEL